MKILSNREYKRLTDASYDAVLYYNECEILKNRKEELLKEKVELEAERDMYKSDLLKVEEKCKNYKKQIEELLFEDTVKECKIEELLKEIKNLKSKNTKLKNKLPKEETPKKATKKVAKKEK